MKNEILKLVTAEKGSISKTKLRNVLKKHSLLDLILSSKPNTNALHEHFYWWYHDLSEYPNKCEVCFKKLYYFKNFKVGYTAYSTCSKVCAAKHPSRIGKIKSTNLEKYGVTSASQRPEVKVKIKNTNMEKYGVKSILQLQITKDGMKKKYGVENISQSNHWKDSVSKTWEQKGGHVFTNGTLLNEIARKTLKQELQIDGDYSYHQLAAWKRDGETFDINGAPRGFSILSYDYAKNEVIMKHECGEEQISDIRTARGFRCLTCHPLKYSKFECEVYEFILSLEVEAIRNDRKQIYPLELDLFLPKFNIGIECNGDFWHSYDTHETKEERNKHLTKLESCLDKNIELIQITEHEWKNKQDFVKSIIISRLGKAKKYHARKLECKEISTKDAANFFKENHIQGSAAAKVAFGLFEGSMIVAAASAGPVRFTNSQNWELIRFATKLNCSANGGFSKLISRLMQVLKNNNVPALESYLDRRIFSGNSLIKTGWALKTTSSPGYCWLLGGTRLGRNKTQKHRLPKLLGDRFMKMLSEAENMRNVGARRLWDCGQYLFIKYL